MSAPAADHGSTMSTPPADRGSTTIADRAVRRIAERAATEALAPGDVRTARSAATVRGRRARVDVTVSLPYPAVLDDAGEKVRAHVADRTARLTGLAVPSARVRVRRLSRRDRSDAEPLGPAEATMPAVPVEGRSVARRPWAQRRFPVAVLVLCAAAVCGLFLYDVLAVHAAGQPSARWRTRLMEWLSTHGPDSGAWPGVVLAGAVFALGVWLLVVAVTPGVRSRLPMSAPLPGVRATLDRRAAADALRDAVVEVPGVGRVRVRVGRRTARIRAGLEFGDPEAAHRAVTKAAEAAAAEFGLARPLRLRLRLRTEPEWRAPAPSPPAGDPTPQPGDPAQRSTP
ncbi:DUF6286 domain-containing protein [Streptomyces sp. NPDC041068]|uniref:DUF6286 domain-containing protein n=1 Tax=Streptomyces sp. NPDC041068 TaxID=3155130 RepID=UPI0033FD583F